MIRHIVVFIATLPTVTQVDAQFRLRASAACLSDLPHAQNLVASGPSKIGLRTWDNVGRGYHTPVVYADRLYTWELVINESDRARLYRWRETSGGFRTIRISPQNLGRLKNAVSESGFFDLSMDAYGTPTPDGFERAIHIVDGDREKEITLYRFDAEDMAASSDPSEYEQVAELWRVIRSLIRDGEALDHRAEDRHAIEVWKQQSYQIIE